MPRFDWIALDADDTLWHNERLYVESQARLAQILARYPAALNGSASPAWVSDRLYETEMRNLEHFGYGIKAFTLSMIETAVELTGGAISGEDIRALLEQAKHMLNAEVELLETVAEALPVLAKQYRLMMITKGDLLDQERKIARSGIGQYFQTVEVLSEKSPASYQKLLEKYNIPAARFMMVGNSLRSDILPILELGGSAVYIPYYTTWAHEAAELPTGGQNGFYGLQRLAELPPLLERLEAETI